jgi:hypothetical protein
MERMCLVLGAGASNTHATKHRQSGAFADDFAEAGEHGLQLGHRQDDGIHVCPFFWFENEPARTPTQGRTGWPPRMVNGLMEFFAEVL